MINRNFQDALNNAKQISEKEKFQSQLNRTLNPGDMMCNTWDRKYYPTPGEVVDNDNSPS